MFLVLHCGSSCVYGLGRPDLLWKGTWALEEETECVVALTWWWVWTEVFLGNIFRCKLDRQLDYAL